MLFIKVSPFHILAANSSLIVDFDQVKFPPEGENWSIPPEGENWSKEAYLYCDERNNSSIRGIITRVDHDLKLVHVSVQWQTLIEDAY